MRDHVLLSLGVINPHQRLQYFHLKAKSYNLKCIHSLFPLHLTFLFSPLAWFHFSLSSLQALFNLAHPGDKTDIEEGCFSWPGLVPSSLPILCDLTLYSRRQPPFFPRLLACSAALVAISNTSLTPSFVFAEHSK